MYVITVTFVHVLFPYHIYLLD